MMRFMKNRKGVAVIEYALLASLIAVAAITVLGQVSTAVNAKFTEVKTELEK
jgi:Flp pilus assembly pilin Flp